MRWKLAFARWVLAGVACCSTRVECSSTRAACCSTRAACCSTRAACCSTRAACCSTRAACCSTRAACCSTRAACWVPKIHLLFFATLGGLCGFVVQYLVNPSKAKPTEVGTPPQLRYLTPGIAQKIQKTRRPPSKREITEHILGVSIPKPLFPPVSPPCPRGQSPTPKQFRRFAEPTEVGTPSPQLHFRGLLRLFAAKKSQPCKSKPTEVGTRVPGMGMD